MNVLRSVPLRPFLAAPPQLKPQADSKKLTSELVASFPPSIIRDTSLKAEAKGAVNLSQGYPEYPTPQGEKYTAIQSIVDGLNQYPKSHGTDNLREALANELKLNHGLDVDPKTEITITCGATEAGIDSLRAITNPGDEIVLFEPYYENYGPQAKMAGATPKFVPLQETSPGQWSFNRKDLADAFNEKTKAIIINTPNNPTGKVFTREELEYVASLCKKWNTLAITDEVYDHFLYDGKQHVSMASLDGMRDRTITIGSASKDFAASGWRVGWAVAPPFITECIRKVHDFTTVAAPHPLQEGVGTALGLPPSYYEDMAKDYEKRGEFLVNVLTKAGFQCAKPSGAYYIFADFSNVKAPVDAKSDDMKFSDWLMNEVGVAGVPGRAFYVDAKDGATKMRFSFGKKMSVLEEAEKRLAKLSSKD